MPQTPEQIALERKIASLEEELRVANLRADLLGKMIEVAEKRLGIDIKKKFGAQLSNLSLPLTQAQG